LTIFYRIVPAATRMPPVYSLAPGKASPDSILDRRSMRILSGIGYGFMALVLAGGWAGIFWQSNSVDLASVEASRSALSELRAIDAGWNQRLVDARLHASAAKFGPSLYRASYGQLEVNTMRLGDARIGGELVRLKHAFDDKSAQVERYAATLAEMGKATEAADADRAALIGKLAEAIFDQAWLAPTGPRLDTLARAIGRSFDDALVQAELYRIGLVYYSGFLLAVLAFLVWNLDQRRRQMNRINGQLREANETLEARDAARTRELAQALARLKESEAMRKSAPQTGRLAAETERLLELLSSENADEAALTGQFAQVRTLLEELRGRS